MDKDVQERDVTEEEMFEWLDSLQEEGSVNMWGAAIPLMEKFSMSIIRARGVLHRWMHSYDQRHGIEPPS